MAFGAKAMLRRTTTSCARSSTPPTASGTDRFSTSSTRSSQASQSVSRVLDRCRLSSGRDGFRLGSMSRLVVFPAWLIWALVFLGVLMPVLEAIEHDWGDLGRGAVGAAIFGAYMGIRYQYRVLERSTGRVVIETQRRRARGRSSGQRDA